MSSAVASFAPATRLDRASRRVARGRSSSRPRAARAAAEPDWKTKQREQDALISVEEEAVKAKVALLLEPILAAGGADGASASETSPASGAPPDLAGKIRGATAALESGLVERETEVRLLLLAAFCGEHLLLLGPRAPPSPSSDDASPPCAVAPRSSSVSSRASPCPRNCSDRCPCAAWRTTITCARRGIPPHRHRRFRRRGLQGELAILNSLTILNERLFDNGNERVKVPLLCLVGA